MKIVHWLCALCLVAAAVPSAAQVRIVRHGKAVARIVADPADSVDMRAAALLQELVGRISGARLPVVAPGKPRRGDIVLGAGDARGLTEDGFRLKTRDGRLMISDGGGKGTIYGVVTLLEQYLGVACYGNNAWRLTRSRDVTIPALDHAENPAFRYRQSQCYAMAEPFYRDWFRFEEPQETFAGRTFVPVQNDFDEPLLKDIASTSGGKYYRAEDGESMAAAMKEIDALEKTSFEQQTIVNWRELAPGFIVGALFCMLLAFLLENSIMKRIP